LLFALHRPCGPLKDFRQTSRRTRVRGPFTGGQLIRIRLIDSQKDQRVFFRMRHRHSPDDLNFDGSPTSFRRRI
jgi:hypothetical protein